MPSTHRLALAPILAILLWVNPAVAENPGYALSIKDHKFQPTEIEIPANQKVALEISNLDATPEEFESVELRREKVIPGGGRITLSIGPLKPGRYEFFGDFNPTTARGHIVVK